MDERELIRAGYRYALSLTHEPADAEDLVQSAAARLFDRKGELGPRALLFTTIRNLFYDQWRRGRVVAFTPLEQEPAGSAGHPGDRLDLERLLGRLRPEEREALYLNAVEGYTAEEIGRLAGRPRNTVLSWLHRARKRLLTSANPAASNPAKER